MIEIALANLEIKLIYTDANSVPKIEWSGIALAPEHVSWQNARTTISDAVDRGTHLTISCERLDDSILPPSYKLANNLLGLLLTDSGCHVPTIPANAFSEKSLKHLQIVHSLHCQSDTIKIAQENSGGTNPVFSLAYDSPFARCSVCNSALAYTQSKKSGNDPAPMLYGREALYKPQPPFDSVSSLTQTNSVKIHTKLEHWRAYPVGGFARLRSGHRYFNFEGVGIEIYLTLTSEAGSTQLVRCYTTMPYRAGRQMIEAICNVSRRMIYYYYSSPVLLQQAVVTRLPVCLARLLAWYKILDINGVSGIYHTKGPFFEDNP